MYTKIKIVLVSSSQVLVAARLIASQISNKNPAIDCVVWREKFESGGAHGKVIWDVISEMVADASFAIIFMRGDDEIVRLGDPRDEPKRGYTTRDNVLIELGAFVQKLGPENVAVLYDGRQDYILPTDIKAKNFRKCDFDYAFPKNSDIEFLEQWLQSKGLLSIENTEKPIKRREDEAFKKKEDSPNTYTGKRF